MTHFLLCVLLFVVAVCLLGVALRLGEQKNRTLQAIGSVVFLVAALILYQSVHQGLGLSFTQRNPAFSQVLVL